MPTLKSHSYFWILIFFLALGATDVWAAGSFWKPKAKVNTTSQTSVPPGILYPPLPTNMSLPTYDYAAPETCAGCHFLLGLDHTSRALGVIWNDQTQTWQLTGSGWLASAHSQTEHGSTENTFCAKCHSPLQASAAASFNNGLVSNASDVPQTRIQAVTCGTCHPPDNVTAVLGALYPNAVDGGAVAIYLWKGLNNPASYQTLEEGLNADGTSKEDLLCLNCHEQRHNTDDSAFEEMYTGGRSAGFSGYTVRCIDCHMAPYQTIGGGDTGLPLLSEVFHDWNVGADLPYSCGVEGSGRGATCHFNGYTQFTVTDAQNIIPFIRSQHREWWSLSPFNNQPQVAVSAHSAMTAADYKVLWQEIAQADSNARK
jgi:hypothetical protein